MSTIRTQAIAGVSPGAENIVTTAWPSVSSTSLGRGLGQLYETIPLKINGVKLSYILFTLPTVPLALAVYAWLKLAGSRYVLTNRSVQIWQGLGMRLGTQVALSDIADVAIEQQAGQAFYKAADLVLRAADGRALARLDGVAHADVFRQTILKSRDARASVASSLATISARHSA